VDDPGPSLGSLPLSHLPEQEKAKRAGSFGEVASDYARYRPGPPLKAVDWILPERVDRVVDLGAGTGAMSRLLVDRADEVVAIEPDDRMRLVLGREVPGAQAVQGRGESIPLPDSSVDVVVASSSWHWMDPVPTLAEVARVLVPGGTLATVWSGADPDGAFLVQAQALLTEQATSGVAADPDGPSDPVANLILGDARRPAPTLVIPYDAPFDQPEHEVFTWDVALDADELIGMLGTFSWILTMPEEQRRRVKAEASRLLEELLGVQGEVTVDVAFRADTWRTRRHRRPGPIAVGNPPPP